jgi:hypothetical protein
MIRVEALIRMWAGTLLAIGKAGDVPGVRPRIRLTADRRSHMPRKASTDLPARRLAVFTGRRFDDPLGIGDKQGSFPPRRPRHSLRSGREQVVPQHSRGRIASPLINTKLGLRSRTEATRFAVKHDCLV